MKVPESASNPRPLLVPVCTAATMAPMPTMATAVMIRLQNVVLMLRSFSHSERRRSGMRRRPGIEPSAGSIPPLVGERGASVGAIVMVMAMPRFRRGR